MARNKKNNEGEMGSGDSDDEFYNVKVTYNSGVAGNKSFGKSEVKKDYSPPRTKVKYDYKFDSSSDEESQNSNSKRNKKESAQKCLGDDDNENEKKGKHIGESNTLLQSTSKVKDKINEGSHNMSNNGDKALPNAVDIVSASQDNISSMSSTVNVPRPHIGVVPSMVVMPSSMVVSQSPVMNVGSMIVPSAVGMAGQNIMPGAVNLIPPQSMMSVAGGMLRGPNPIGGLVTNPSSSLPTSMMGINSVPNQMAGMMGIQGNFVGVPGAGAQGMGLQGGMINLGSMSGINMTVPGNMLRMAGAGNSMLRMQGPGGSIMGIQAPNNMLGISRPGSNILGAPGNLMGVQPPTTGIVGNSAGVVVNPSNAMNNSLVGNSGNLMVMAGMMGNPGSLVGSVGNPNVVGASQANLINKISYAQGNSSAALRGVPPPLTNVRGKPPAPGSFRWPTNPMSQSNPPKPDSPTAIKSFSSTAFSSPSSPRGGKDDDEDELSREDRDNLSDHSSQLEVNESQSSVRELPNSFKNDGSFMEMFKKMREGSNLEKGTSDDKSGKNSGGGDSSSVKKPPVMLSGIVGKRRGGRVLKTGLVKKVKKESEADEEKNPKDAWSIYMAEVKKYREASCEEEGKTRPLVK